MGDRPTLIQGGLIGIERDGVVGWAWDGNAPEAPVQVKLFAGGQLVGQAVANQFDDERVRTLVGPGVPGFITRLAVAPNGRYPLSLRVHDAAGNPLGEPLSVHAEAELSGLIGLEPMASYEGNIDGVYDGALKGWARDADAPDRPMELELRDTGVTIGHCTANLLREDLRLAGLHHGLYGFSLDLPVSLLDGRAHSLSVGVAGSKVTLRGGPIAFGPLATSALMTQVSALQSEVAALRQLVDGLIAPDGAFQRLVLRTLSERIAATADIGRDQTERDMAALRAMVFAAAERAAGAEPEHYGPKPRRARGG